MKSVAIAGSSFLLDVDRELHINEDDPSIRLDIRSMNNRDSHYAFLLDLATFAICHEQREGVIPVIVPPMFRVDEEGMRKKWGYGQSRPIPTTDAGFKPNMRRIQTRLNSYELPKFKIAGIGYAYDMSNGFVSPQDVKPITWRPVPIAELNPSPNGHQFLFDIDTRAIIPGKVEDQPWKAGQLLVELPPPVSMDPVAYALGRGEKPTAYVKRYPVQETRDAIVFERLRSGKLSFYKGPSLLENIVRLPPGNRPENNTGERSRKP